MELMGGASIMARAATADWPAVSHSAPTSGGFSLGGGCRRAASFPFVGGDAMREALPPTSALMTRSHSESERLNFFGTVGMTIEQFKKMHSIPKKTPEEESGCETDSETLSNCGSSTDLADEIVLTPERCRKSVRFADDCGRPLYDVRVMTEPSDYPPRISPSVLRRLRGETCDLYDDSVTATAARWQLAFPQPASEYFKFRQRLETGKVSLENIVLRNEECGMTGTIKVANVAFEKRVFVRWTSNGWTTFLDRQASFQAGISKAYDTFVFDITLPRDSDKVSRIEFCVGFVAGTAGAGVTEYWDSNDDANYALVLPESSHESPPPHSETTSFGRHHFTDDAYNMEHRNWGSFASWRSFSTDAPYW